MHKSRIGMALAIMAAAAPALAGAEPRSGVAAGRRIAEDICSACHVVEANPEFPPLLKQPTPSFADIANAPGTSSARLRHFISRTHWDEKTVPMTMPDTMLSDEQKDQVIRYILSLRRRP